MKIIYEANDGTKFSSKDECLNYEERQTNVPLFKVLGVSAGLVYMVNSGNTYVSADQATNVNDELEVLTSFIITHVVSELWEMKFAISLDHKLELLRHFGLKSQ